MDEQTNERAAASRRTVLQSGAALAAGIVAETPMPAGAQAQGGVASPDAELARLQGQRRILLKGAVILTLDPAVGDFAKADLLIEEGKIRQIAPDIAASTEGVAVVDAANRIIIPGFIDTHSHSYQGLLRGILPTGIVDPDYVRDVQNLLTPAYTPSDVYAGVLTTALSFINMGTTGVVDLSQISHTPEHSDACLRALQDSGIRAIYGYSRGAGSATKWPHDIIRIKREHFASDDQLVTLALGASLDVDVLKAAREAGVPAVMHFRVNAAPGLALGQAGVLREGDLFIHCTHLTDAAWQMIKAAGGRISMSPLIETSMAHGNPATQDALDRGIRPSLSSDHGTTVAQDFFSIMRMTYAHQRWQVLARQKRGEQNVPSIISTRDVLEFATKQGAHAANIDRKVGTLAPGKEADLLLLRTDRLESWPLNNAYNTVVSLMTPAHVDAVFIAGKVKKWRGELVGVDIRRVQQLAQDARDGLFRRSGFALDLLA
jgi:5-methylthioadenosine/S-adenosylhomocysteine deaminase